MKQFFSLIKFFLVVGIIVIALELCGALVLHNVTGNGSAHEKAVGDGIKRSNSTSRNAGESSGTANAAGEGEGSPDRDSSGNGGGDEQTNSSEATFISGDEITALSDASLGDKIACMGILSKVSQEDLRNIMKMLNDGVTYGEFAQIRQMLSGYLSEQEIQKLIDILDKNRKKLADKGIEP